jgi:hypothetical protein
MELIERPKVKRCLKDDIEFGEKGEKYVLNVLEKYFNKEIIQESKNNPYCIYDAKSDNTRYEIKCRRCKYETYSTTIVPYHKKKAYEEGKRLLFVFSFVNGLYYIEYRKKLFDSFELKDVTYYRSGIVPKPVKHFCIPTELLTKIQL